MKRIMCVTIVTVLATSAIAQDKGVQSGGWMYFDFDGEERGWQNSIPDGENLAIIDCEFIENKDYYRFFYCWFSR
ncbi:hypothetical protein [Aquibium oceanicum]|uniref:hypothetical protein n=1 Tax=Aquibium oceanicum TaxID=1670800 RepID=UPI0012FF8F04|nr:hypothetical protein [Aquibium oceanicum]